LPTRPLLRIDVETFPQFSAFPLQSVSAALQSTTPVAQFSAFPPIVSTLMGRFSASQEIFSANFREVSAFPPRRMTEPEIYAENFFGLST
jgi:hypothetical protein